MVMTRGKEGWKQVEEGKGAGVNDSGDLTLGGKDTIQYIDDVLWNCTLETYIILLMLPQ